MTPPIDTRNLRQKAHLVKAAKTGEADPAGEGRGFRQYKVSSAGQMTLPATARQRWGLTPGGQVEVADLGFAVVVLPRKGSEAVLDAWLTSSALEEEVRQLSRVASADAPDVGR